MKQDTGSQAGDLYSAAVVIKEVFARNDPYTEYEDMDLGGMLSWYMEYIWLNGYGNLKKSLDVCI